MEQPIIDPIPVELLKSELTPDKQLRMTNKSNNEIYVVTAHNAPNVMQEIGRQPVLSFGNSSGDYSMAEYVITNNKYKSMAFMLCCDDLERENGKLDAAQSMQEACQKNGWIPVSMKNDWKTIYGEGVTKKN